MALQIIKFRASFVLYSQSISLKLKTYLLRYVKIRKFAPDLLRSRYIYISIYIDIPGAA